MSRQGFRLLVQSNNLITCNLNRNHILIRNYSKRIFRESALIQRYSFTTRKNSYNQFGQSRTIIQWSIFGFSKKTTNDEHVVNEVGQVDLMNPETVANTDISQAGYIPDPPQLISEEIIINSLGEPTLTSLGIVSGWPSGWVQLMLEFLHIDCSLPWYASIILYTLIIRTLMLPITIKTQRHSTKMRIYGPQLAANQAKVTKAMKSGDPRETRYEFTEFLSVNKIELKSFFIPILQIPVMMSTYFGIKQICTLPVESICTGGIFWFQNLAATDPYYILPLISASTLFIMIQRGIDFGQSASAMAPLMKKIMYSMVAVTAIFLCTQSSGIAFYIVCSNFYSLLVSLIINRPDVKKFFDIPIVSPEMEKFLIEESKKHAEPDFLKGFRKSFKSQIALNELKEREKYAQISDESLKKTNSLENEKKKEKKKV